MILPMKIGTPLSPNATRVMLLGSGELGKEVIIALQHLGVEVIAVDRYKDAPGHQVAHRSHVIDMTNSEALINLVKSEKPHYIVPEIEAINTDVVAQIEKSGDAIVIPTVNAVQLTMNREGIRDLAANQLKLPTSPFASYIMPNSGSRMGSVSVFGMVVAGSASLVKLCHTATIPRIIIKKRIPYQWRLLNFFSSSYIGVILVTFSHTLSQYVLPCQ